MLHIQVQGLMLSNTINETCVSGSWGRRDEASPSTQRKVKEIDFGMTGCYINLEEEPS